MYFVICVAEMRMGLSHALTLMRIGVQIDLKLATRFLSMAFF